MARPREFDEDAVVAAAGDLFWSAGYAATSIEDLVVATGLSRGSLYGAFADKHRLYLRALDRYCAETLERFRDALRGPEVGALERLTRHVVGTAASCGGNTRGCFLAGATAERAGTDEGVAERARVTYGEYEELIVECLAQARRHGDVPADLDPGAVGALLLITVRGMEALGKAGRSRAFMDGVARSSLAFAS